MAEMTLDQQRAIALASARLRLQQQPPEGNIGTGPGQFAAVEDIPGMGGAAPTPQAPRSMLDRLRGAAETGIAMAGGAVTAPLVPMAQIYGTLTSGKFGTQEGIRAGQELGNRLAQNIQGQIGPKTEAGQEYTRNVSNALAATGLQGLPMPLMQDLQMLAPAATRQVAGQIATSKPVLAAGEKLAERAAAKAEARSLKSWEQAPQIEATEAARRLGAVVNPAQSAQTVKSKVLVGAVGEQGVNREMSQQNLKTWNKVAREDLGLPAGTPLDEAAFNTFREKNSGSYKEVAKLGALVPDENVKGGLSSLKVDPNNYPKRMNESGVLIDDPTPIAINNQVDGIIRQLDEGVTGANAISQIRQLREQAKVTFRNPGAQSVDLDVAKTKLAIADELENLIGANLTDNPRLLSQFRKDRVALAKSYDWERATDPIVKQVDPNQLAADVRNGLKLTGRLGDLAKVAGTFPEVTSMAPAVTAPMYQNLRRGGAGGTIGFATIGGPEGAAVGAGITSLAGRLTGKLLGSERAQNALAVPKDYRLPLPQDLAPPIPQSRAIVPYVAPQEILMPGQGPQAPNFVFGRPEPQITPGMAAGPRALPQPSAEGTLNALRAEDARRAAMSRTLGQEAEARAAAAEAAGRRPTSGEIILDIDPITGRLRESSQGIKGASPEQFRNFGAPLESAASKVTAGRLFDLTADEKIAWSKAKVDIAEVAPGFKSLSEKAVAEKMLDRQWVRETATKAREKAAAFEEIASRHYARVEGELARAADIEKRMAALADRQRMLDLAAQLEESLSRPRPDTSRKLQGRKTYEFRKNMLAPERTVENELVR